MSKTKEVQQQMMAATKAKDAERKAALSLQLSALEAKAKDKRADLIFQMQQILVDDAAVLIDGYYNSSMIYSKNVGNAHIHTADYYWLTTEITPAQ